MSEKEKKLALLLGHLLCIFILIYCMADSQIFAREEETKEAYTVVKPAQSGENDLNQPARLTEPPKATKPPEPTESAEATKLPEVTESAEATEPPEPTKSAEATKPPEPTESAEATKAPEASESAEATKPPEPTESAEATKPPEATKAPEAPESAEATKAPEPTESAEATKTPEPTESAEATKPPEPTESPESERARVKQQVLADISEGKYDTLDNKTSSWWFRRKSNHVSSGSGEEFAISEYQGYYLNKSVEDGDKVIYLTLDCGYSSSNTNVILDVLKKHNVKVTFFVTKFFLDGSPKEVCRMVEEGHIVANHSVSHLDLTSLSDETVYEEIIGCEEKFYELTGTQMSLYFRPPTGAYSRRTMQITEDLGYKSIFWSIAYKDYDTKNQPGKEYVLDHFKEYHHSGAIALMHNDSVSNMEAMDELLTFLEEQGYRFGTLDELE